jgi:pimeloyl-ACP methyl ester carboxylesterase
VKARVNGVELYFETQGEAAGPPVVLVHGSRSDHHTWDAVAPLLARRCRVTAYDRRGHGESGASGAQGMREDAADLGALIEQLTNAPAHVVGNGVGATVVLLLVIERPDLFASVAVHEPNPRSLDVDRLASYGGPLLISHGDQSPPSVIQMLDEISDVLPRTQRWIFRRAGDAPHATHPDDFALVVGSFIHGVAGAA